MRRPARGRLRLRGRECAFAPGVEQDVKALLGHGPPDEQEPRPRAGGQVGGRGHCGLAPEPVLDGLRRDMHVQCAAGLDIGADVRAVGDDRVGGAVEAAKRQVGDGVRSAARVCPEGRPQDQRPVPQSCSGPRRERREPSTGWAHDGAVGGAARQSRELGRSGRAVGEGERPVARGAAVGRASAEQAQLDSLALVQAGERSHAIGRDVAGDEQDRLHASACL